MANAVAEGAKEKGAEVSVLFCSGFSADMVDQYDAIAFGCPAMGAEVLEEAEFEPMFSSCKPKLGGKRVALFGSYGWVPVTGCAAGKRSAVTQTSISSATVSSAMKCRMKMVLRRAGHSAQR